MDIFHNSTIFSNLYNGQKSAFKNLLERLHKYFNIVNFFRLLKSSYKNSEFNPVTLKFKIKQLNFCHRHRHLNNILFRCLPNAIRALFIPDELSAADKKQPKQIRQKRRDLKAEKLKDQLIAGINENQSASIAMGRRSLVDDLRSNCSACLKENKEFSSLNSSRERLYNSQPSLAFKFHLGMCMVVFVTLACVIFISELKK